MTESKIYLLSFQEVFLRDVSCGKFQDYLHRAAKCGLCSDGVMFHFTHGCKLQRIH